MPGAPVNPPAAGPCSAGEQIQAFCVQIKSVIQWAANCIGVKRPLTAGLPHIPGYPNTGFGMLAPQKMPHT